MVLRKRKLHLNWDADRLVWEIKKAFGFLPNVRSYTEDALGILLRDNQDIDVVLKY